MYEIKPIPPKNPLNLLNDTSKPRPFPMTSYSTPSLELDRQGLPHKSWVADSLALNSTQHTINERAHGWVSYQGGE